MSSQPTVAKGLFVRIPGLVDAHSSNAHRGKTPFRTGIGAIPRMQPAASCLWEQQSSKLRKAVASDVGAATSASLLLRLRPGTHTRFRRHDDEIGYASPDYQEETGPPEGDPVSIWESRPLCYSVTSTGSSSPPRRSPSENSAESTSVFPSVPSSRYAASTYSPATLIPAPTVK